MRLLIADDHPVFLESLSLLVGKVPGYEVVGKMSNGREVLEYLRQSPADMILADIQMPGMGGIELVGEVRRLYPKVKVLMLTMLEDTETVKAAMKAGAAGYVFKSASLEAFAQALDTVAAGDSYYSEELMQRVVESEAMGGLDGLTDRELEIVRLISSGLKSSEIAKQLFISVNTVETHRKNIFSKTGVKNAVGLSHYARKHGII
ncbi:MAG TPA: response regulator transcription factor [Puia sp.]|jgi:DNA-binding NarL/FixJ family response regulator|nr:response regulator transcription factor [Puia sp.]